jgi:preprotein translocase subunit SecD
MEAPTDNTEPMRLASAPGAPERTESLYVAKEVLLDQNSIQSARLGRTGQEFQTIEVSLTDAGRNQFAKITREHLHQRLAIVIAGKLWMAPVIQTEIPGGQIQITGAFGRDEAGALVAEINEAAGKRP